MTRCTAAGPRLAANATAIIAPDVSASDLAATVQAKALYALEIQDGTRPGASTDAGAEDYANRATGGARPRAGGPTHPAAPEMRRPLNAAAMTHARRGIAAAGQAITEKGAPSGGWRRPTLCGCNSGGLAS